MKRLRDSSYYRKVFIGKRTVKDGECCAVWDMRGRQKLIEGPRRQWLFISRVSFLDHYFADQNQYLVLENVDGSTQHMRGPVGLFANPLHHKRVHVADAVRIESFESVLVYSQRTPEESDPRKSGSQADTTGRHLEISRRLVTGPSLLFLEPSESLHSFKWFTDGTDRLTDSVVLSTVPETLVVNATDVHTADHALVTVKLQLTLQIASVERMVAATDTPITELTTAAVADVVAIAAHNTFAELVDQSDKLSQLVEYTNLTSRAAAIGVTAKKVVYGGYTASATLKTMHERALQSRNQLQLRNEEEQQDLDLKEFTLRRKLQLMAQEHDAQVNAEKHSLELEQRSFEQELGISAGEMARQRQRTQAQHAQKVEYVKQLAEKGVDVTAYLCAQHTPVDRVVHITGMPQDVLAESALLNSVS